jgi:hypothetical protein
VTKCRHNVEMALKVIDHELRKEYEEAAGERSRGGEIREEQG